jgi:hypothetical protein
MTILLSFLATAAGKLIVGALGVVIAILAAWLKGRLSGAKAERNAQKAKEADAYEQHLKDLAAAATARPSGGLSDDPNNRDR